MKKFLVFVLLVIMMFTLVLSACKKPTKSAGNSGNTGNKPTGKVVVAESKTLGAGGYGAVFDVALDPFNENYMAARCDMGSLYVSFDAGESWIRHNINGTLYTVKYDKSTEGVVWAGGSGVYKSVDHGRNFQLVYPQPDGINSQGHNYENANYWIYSDQSDYKASYQVWSIAINRNSGGKNVFAAQRLNGTDKKILIHEATDGETFHEFVSVPYSNVFKLDYDEANNCLVVVTAEKIYEIDQSGQIVAQIDVSMAIHHATGNVLAFDSYYDAANNKNTFVFAVNKDDEHALTALYKTNNLRDTSSYVDLIPDLVATPLNQLFPEVNERQNGYASYEYDEWCDVGTKGYVKHSFKWKIGNVCVVNDDTIYFYHENEIPLYKTDGTLKGTNRRTLAYVKYQGGQYSWVYGFPHKPVAYEQNKTWQDSDSGFCFGMSSSPDNPNALVMSTVIGVFYTPDGERIYQRHSNLADTKNLKIISETGVEGEISVTAVSTTGLDVQNTYKTVTDPFDEKHLLMACTDIGLIQSFDGGETWVRTMRQWNDNGTESSTMSAAIRNTCYDVHFDKERRNVVYALWSGTHNAPYSPQAHWINGNGVFAISYDGGTTWTAKHIVPNDKCIPYRMDVVYNGGSRTFLVATEGLGFFISKDSGETFTSMNNGIPYSNAVQSTPMIFGNEIISCSEGIFAITAASATAKKPDPDDDTREVYDRALYKWNEQLEKFEEIALPKETASVRDIVYSEKYGCLYIAAICRSVSNTKKLIKDGGGIYQYKDGQLTQIFDAKKSVWGVDLDSQDRLYATLQDGAIYRYTDNNTKFELLIDGMFHILKDITFGHTDNVLYVATFGGGTERITLKEV